MRKEEGGTRKQIQSPGDLEKGGRAEGGSCSKRMPNYMMQVPAGGMNEISGEIPKS